jgi:2-keto-4-pentenoate hydratase/2-oxohepta-3-ene-1,7-dioic acid hydratase in catechol pathway
VKIVCIGRNYGGHAAELNSAIPDEPVIFMKPASALLGPDEDFTLPEFSNEIHHEIELVLRIGSRARRVSAEQAPRHIDAVTVGLDFTARDLQSDLKSKGLPWEKAKAFDGSAAIGEWLPVSKVNMENTEFSLSINDELRQEGKSSDMLFSFDSLLYHITRFVTLEPGDLVFTGTPEGVGPVSSGDRLIGSLEGEPLLNLRVTESR